MKTIKITSDQETIYGLFREGSEFDLIEVNIDWLKVKTSIGNEFWIKADKTDYLK